MAVIALIVIIIVFSALYDSSAGGGEYNNYGGFGSNNKNNSSTGRSSRNYDEPFEEDGSFYDRDGNEHIIDDEGYCEDCDDYHDDF